MFSDRLSQVDSIYLLLAVDVYQNDGQSFDDCHIRVAAHHSLDDSIEMHGIYVQRISNPIIVQIIANTVPSDEESELQFKRLTPEEEREASDRRWSEIRNIYAAVVMSDECVP